jgi:hypothetical protein
MGGIPRHCHGAGAGVGDSHSNTRREIQDCLCDHTHLLGSMRCFTSIVPK